MKPVAIFRHWLTEGPGYFATTLDRRGIPWELIALDEGAAVPADPRGFRGLAFMGGPMSVNDDLPWIPPVLELIKQAVAQGVPVIGHCLGGQLLSKALGGVVSRAPIKEIGWGEVRPTPVAQAQDWFGQEPVLGVFHWHGETFSIPPGATRLLASEHCANQAFALGPHLGLQCHIEMTQELVASWCETGAREIERSSSPAVQQAREILEQAPQRLTVLHHLAEHVYGHWLGSLSPATFSVD